jgi:aromatic-amino-acid transaminase
VASSGGAGAISNALWNYTSAGDTVLTHDWFWTPYRTMCQDTGRSLETFTFLDDRMTFNLEALRVKVTSLIGRQDSLVIILNSANHNPTGYCITDDEWDEIIDLIVDVAKNPAKTVSLLVDLAYIDYTDDPAGARVFLRKFSGLPENIVVAIAYSMSKSFTIYGQRTGALVGVSSSRSVIDEFEQVSLVTGRARWSNVNRGGMQLLDNIGHDPGLLETVNTERRDCNAMIAERAGVFVEEARRSGLEILPYRSGFFITIPCSNPDEVSKSLIEENVFVASLSKGIRIAACSVPVWQMKGLAKRIYDAMRKF